MNETWIPILIALIIFLALLCVGKVLGFKKGRKGLVIDQHQYIQIPAFPKNKAKRFKS